MSDTGNSGGSTGSSTGSGTDQGSQGAPAGQPQGGNGGQGSAGGADTGASSGSSTQRYASVEDAIAAVEQRERENANYRERIRQFEEAERQRQQEGMTELERRDARIRELEDQNTRHARQLAMRDLRDDAADVASELGFRNPRLAHRLVEADDVIADDGTIDADKVKAALQKALRSDPYLAGGTGAEGGAGRSDDGAAGGSFNDQLRRQIRAGKGGQS